MADLTLKYPGLADQIGKAYKAGYTDDQIEKNVQLLIYRAERDNWSDKAINSTIFGHKGERAKGWRQDTYTPSNFEKFKDYLGMRTIRKTTPIEIEAAGENKSTYELREQVFGTGKEEELRRVISRGFAGFTAGVSDVLQGGATYPETGVGAFAGAGAEFTGFLLGPFKAANKITGGYFAPTRGGLKGVTQLMRHGGANLGLATAISSILPAFENNDTLWGATHDIIESTAMNTLVGALFPVMSMVPTKPLRMATGLAVMDMIRSGDNNIFTIDDVVKGIKDGTISDRELAERAFGYVMDTYFLSKTPSMQKQLMQLEGNVLARELRNVNSKEYEDVIIALRDHESIPGMPTEGTVASKKQKEAKHGSEGEFKETYFTIQDALVSGKDLSMFSKKEINDALLVEKTHRDTDAELQALNSGKIRRTFRGMARAFIDSGYNVKSKLVKNAGNLGKLAKMKWDSIGGAVPKAQLRIVKALDDIYGGKDGEPRLTLHEETLLNYIIESRRVRKIDEYRDDIVHPDKRTGSQHDSYLKIIKETAPEIFEKVNTRADRYFEIMREQLNDLYDNGLISKKVFDKLKNVEEYSPREFIKFIDPDVVHDFGGKVRTSSRSGIQRLESGDFGKLNHNARELLSQVITRTQANIARNNATKVLYKIAKSQPDNGIVRMRKIWKDKDNVIKKEKIPHDMTQITALIEGKRAELFMQNELAKEWVGAVPRMPDNVANFVAWISGNRILKAMATGVNPEFALSNFARDIAHSWFTPESEFSPTIPVAAFQMGKQLAKTAKDAATNTGRAIDFINEGGGLEYLVHQGMLKMGSKGDLAEVERRLGWLGEFTERWVRLANREQGIDKGLSPHEATWKARNYMDFNQSGWVSKALDSGIPYLNAGIVGTRGVFRAFKEKPVVTSYKAGQLMVLSMALNHANHYLFKDDESDVPEYDKRNNFIFKLPLEITNDHGEKQRYYMKIPKDQGQRFICALGDALAQKTRGEDVDPEQIVNSLLDALPAVPGADLPPTLDAFLGYALNKDFWRREDIWKGRRDIEPFAEKKSYTHPLMIEIGEATGLSPERLSYFLEQYFTSGNLYTSTLASGTKLLMDQLSDEQRDLAVRDFINSVPFAHRVVGLTRPTEKWRKEAEEEVRKENTRQYLQTFELDKKISKWLQAKNPFLSRKAKKEMLGYIQEQPWDDRDRLFKRVELRRDFHEVRDYSFWITLAGIQNPEVRARIFWSRYKNADKKEQKMLDKELARVPRVGSETFYRTLSEFRKSGETDEDN